MFEFRKIEMFVIEFVEILCYRPLSTDYQKKGGQPI
jgi:hypothetical protein